MAEQRLHAFVSGRVQGVFFRYESQRVAQDLGLMGYARNLPDGRVEVLAEGERMALEGLLEFLREGPRMARVDAVDHSFAPAAGDLDSFHIR
ncbi:MAG: acylphosphatase [Actinomycetota bacterium]